MSLYPITNRDNILGFESGYDAFGYDAFNVIVYLFKLLFGSPYKFNFFVLFVIYVWLVTKHFSDFPILDNSIQI